MSRPSPGVSGRLASRTKTLEANPISAANAEAARLRRAGVQIANFSIGEPDFETPQHIKDAAIAAILPSSPGYVGVFQWAVSLSIPLVAPGTGEDAAFAMAAVLHLVTTLVLWLLGAIGLVMLGLSFSDVLRRTDAGAAAV